MRNILETELITDEQMLSLVGGREEDRAVCKSCTETQKNVRGDTTISPSLEIPLS